MDGGLAGTAGWWWAMALLAAPTAVWWAVSLRLRRRPADRVGRPGSSARSGKRGGPSVGTETSERLFRRAVEVLPGGVNSPVRAFRSVGGVPRFIRRAEGPYLYDADGRRYLDLVNSWGAVLLGHAHPAVVAAVAAQLPLGTSYGAPTEAEVALAELIAELVPSVEMVRLVNSGTEATMSALRLARAATGRPLVVKFAGAYHGHVDSLLVAAGSGALEGARPETPGLPPGTAAATVVVPYNDQAALEAVFDRRGEEVAAVIVEPVAANMGVVPPEPGFLETVARLCRRHGALLVLDEVITGFRLGLSGAQGRFGLRPDLTCLGKVIGGGLPIGAYGGSRALMRQMAPEGPVFQAGTLSGNPLATAAGLAVLRHLREHADTLYPALERRAEGIAAALVEAMAEVGVPFTVQRQGSLLSGFFRAAPARRLEEVRAQDLAAYRRFFHALLEHGVHLPPSPYEALFLSAAWEDEHVERFAEAARAAARVAFRRMP